MHGIGKTVLATHLADDLSGDGGGTFLIDADPHAGASDWSQRRLRAGCPSRFRSCRSQPTQLRRDVCELQQIAANVVIDLPSRECPITQLAVMLADVILVPWQLQRNDPASVASIGRTIAAARASRPELRAAVVLNACAGGVHSREPARRAWLRESLPVLACEVEHRRTFADSTTTGLLVREQASRDGVEDVRQLAQAVRELAT